MDLHTYIERYRLPLEAELQKTLATQDKTVDTLYAMMRYHMGWVDTDLQPVSSYGGKRTRPTLLLLCCEAVGGNWRQVLPAAAAVELIHNFSLVHDDIEDGGDTRRGRATVWSLWGIPQAINVGDALYGLAFSALSRLRETGVPENTISAVLALFGRSCVRLCEGQYLDLDFEVHSSVSETLYNRMIAGKTAALMSCSCIIGSMLGGASRETVQKYQIFGEALGTGFQIMDDILGIWGDPQVTGKPVGDDLRIRKQTLPVIHAMREERRRGSNRLQELYARAEIDEEDIKQMLEILHNVGSKDYCLAQLAQLREEALKAIEADTVKNEAHQALCDLTASVLNREY